MVKYAKLRTERLALDKKSTELKTEEDMIRGMVLREMLGRPQPLFQDKVNKLQAELKMRAYADVTDWPALQQHIRLTGEFDLLQKRVTITAVRERWEAGKTVPGVMQAQEPEVTISKFKEEK
jgi:hypothetical protein